MKVKISTDNAAIAGRINGTTTYQKILNSETPFMLDLLEWQEPSDDSPPYSHLYHLGIARIALRTDDLDSDVTFLKSQGVEFLSEPATVQLDGQPETRFVCFKDPDGTILELVE